MQTIELLTGPSADLFWPAVVAAVAVAVMCGLLSVLVVLCRLAFVGQGVSHAAFGGVGLAYAMGLTGVTAGGELALFAVVGLFSLAAALAIAWMSGGRRAQADTAIGIVLVGAMALGFILLGVAAERAASAGRPAPPGIEAVLFGSIYEVGRAEMWAAWAALALTVGVLVAVWRPMLFWAFDVQSAGAFGVRGGVMRVLLLVLLTLAIVVTMRLAGVVLVTALLVLPGAAAVRVSDRLWRVVGWSVGLGVLGVLGGLVVSFELDQQAGPCIVGVLVVLYGLAWGLTR